MNNNIDKYKSMLDIYNQYIKRIKELNKELSAIIKEADWEEVPQEDLWEDGEISNNTCMIKIYNNVVPDGKWRLIRRKDGQNKKQ